MVSSKKKQTVTKFSLGEPVWKVWPKSVIAAYLKEKNLFLGLFLSITGHVKSCENLGGPSPKAKYTKTPIANKYREGKVKRTPVRGVK